MRRVLRRDMRLLEARYIDLKTLTAEQRLEELLAELAAVFGTGASRPLSVVVPLRQPTIAGMIGVSLRQFQRLKTSLDAEGKLRVDRPCLFTWYG